MTKIGSLALSSLAEYALIMVNAQVMWRAVAGRERWANPHFLTKRSESRHL